MILPKNPNDDISYDNATLTTIYLAGGCFWGVEAYMRRISGVADTECGYGNGRVENPSYEQVCKEHTGHAEIVRVQYDESRVTLSALLDAFLEILDPARAQDEEDQYRNGVYATDPALSERVGAYLSARFAGVPCTIENQPMRNFYPAEEYHQDYLEKNPNGFCHVDLNRLRK